MKKNFLIKSAGLIISFLFVAQFTSGQCKQQGNPNKWLYKKAFSKFKVSYPQKVDYATKFTLFFDAFVFLSAYSFVKVENDRLFYLQFSGPASYPYDVMLTDSLHFYFSGNEVMKLPPRTDYPGEKGALIAFYVLNKEFLDKLSQTNLDSIILRFTPHPKKMPEDESKLVRSFTFKKFSNKHEKLFKEFATCFKKEFE